MGTTVTATSDLIRKLIMGFVVGFASYALPRVLDALSAINASGNFHFTRSLLVSFLAGAIGAAIRYVLAISPINIVPTDALHKLGAKRLQTITVMRPEQRS